MTAYLREHPPVRSQFRSPRRARLTGAIAVHTAESVLDSVGPDTGAENVAAWMTRRDTPGSYHDLVDRDSIVHLVDYGDEAYHDGTGGNRWSLGLSYALRTTDWADLGDDDLAAFIENGALAAARMAAHVKAATGVVVPARRISADQYRDGHPGFVSHAELDPGRRTDPGNAPGQFPWQLFLERFAALTQQTDPDPQELTMADIKLILDRLDELEGKVDAIHRETVQSIEPVKEDKAKGIKGVKGSGRWLLAKIAKGERVS